MWFDKILYGLPYLHLRYRLRYIVNAERGKYMILSGKEIVKHIGKEIIIEPFDPKRVNLTAQPPVPGAHKRIYGDRPVYPHAGGTVVDRTLGSVHPCYRWFWRRGVCGLLDIGDILRAADSDLS